LASFIKGIGGSANRFDLFYFFSASSFANAAFQVNTILSRTSCFYSGFMSSLITTPAAS
jgi:hypothetical protein